MSTPDKSNTESDPRIEAVARDLWNIAYEDEESFAPWPYEEWAHLWRRDALRLLVVADAAASNDDFALRPAGVNDAVTSREGND